MVNFDVVECEITLPSSEKELEFESKIARVQNLLQITKSEAIGIVIRSIWTAIGNGFCDGNWQGLNSSDIEKAIGYNKRMRLFGVLIVSGILTSKLYVADWLEFCQPLLKLYNDVTGNNLSELSLSSVICGDNRYDAYADEGSFERLLSGLEKYNLTYKEKIELCIFTISLFAEYFATSPTADDVENMYKLLQNDIIIRGKIRFTKSICNSLEQAFTDYCENGDREDVWQFLRRFWRKNK